jgi:hypothetical protein
MADDPIEREKAYASQRLHSKPEAFVCGIELAAFSLISNSLICCCICTTLRSDSFVARRSARHAKITVEIVPRTPINAATEPMVLVMAAILLSSTNANEMEIRNRKMKKSIANAVRKRELVIQLNIFD